MRNKRLEGVFDAQPEGQKNIFLAVMQTFKWRFALGAVFNFSDHLTWMILPVIVRELTEHIQNPEASDNSFGVKLLIGTCCIQMAQYYLGEHCF